MSHPDVDFQPNPRRTARKRGPNKLERAKAAEIERCRIDGIERIGGLSDREFLMAGLGLYAGDGAKTWGAVRFANSNPDLIGLFCRWFRRFFDVDEQRLRVRLYLHDDLDLTAAEDHWIATTGVPRSQFPVAYRPAARSTVRQNRHQFGCCHVVYSSSTEMRRLLGMLSAMILVSCDSLDPG